MASSNAKDLNGKRFGRLIVLRPADRTNRHPRWVCQCDCGVVKTVGAPSLNSGKTKSCGCLHRQNLLAYAAGLARVKIGDVYGRLTVIEKAASKNWKSRWLCRCQCGRNVEWTAGNLRSLDSPSCGCARASHGGVANRHLAYKTWASMISRCTNKNTSGYNNYGGRGITVCVRWRESYEAFLADMGHRPSVKYTIDRIDVNGNYEPGNCRWATATEQGQNKRTSRLITIDGRTQCVTAWSREYSISLLTVLGRLRRGWSEEDAIKKPPKKAKPK